MLSPEEARAKVIEIVGARACAPVTEEMEIGPQPARALGRILADNVVADRNYPPFDRSTRDGYAVRSSDAATPGAKLRLAGESRAGVAFEGTVAAGECVRILTGAPLPRGANAVVMQEHVRAEGDFVVLVEPARPGQHFVLAGEHARVGEVVVPRGTRLGYAELAVLAEVGRVNVAVTRRPRVAILSTGDELVPVENAPGPFQIRNSNSISLSAQVALAGGEPILTGIAHDTAGELRERIGQGLEYDILVLSGGVSVGKYDMVEQVLRELGAEFLFDAVAIRPGKPAVFAWCRGKPVFGLPGNPVSTMVTFESVCRSGHRIALRFFAAAAAAVQSQAPASRQRETGPHTFPSRARHLAPAGDALRADRRSPAVGRIGRYRRGRARELLPGGAPIETPT